MSTGHCGWLALTVQACALTDWLGLFPIPVKLPAPALFLVWPRENPDVFAAVDLTPAQGLPPRPRPGGGPGEDYELRPYRPGDAVTSIHWKLTAKQPEDADPILRETLEPLQEALAVTYDHFGPPDEIDAVLARLEALGVKEALFYLDQQVSNSGRLRALLLDKAEERSVQVQVELHPSVDGVLSRLEHVVTTDAIILDKCGSWYNLNRGIIEEAVPEAWVLQLEPLGNWNRTTEEP